MTETTDVKRLKLMHCSDIHLDSPYEGLPADKNEERRRELRSSFMRMMEIVREREIDYVFICGDLLDNRFATGTTAEILIREFRTCPTTKFIIAPGVSDCYSDDSIYRSGRFPENCYFFTSEKLSRMDFEEDSLTVYGWAFTGNPITVNPLTDNQVGDSSSINIVCGYADLDGDVDSTACPISTADLKRFGADYYALGSRHGATDFKKFASGMYSYSGSLSCTGFDRPESGGAHFLTVEHKNGETSISGKHNSFNHLRFATEQIDITGVSSNNEITNRISRLISSKKYDSDTALRVEFTGEVDPRFQVPLHMESDSFGLYYFEAKDKTLPLYNTASFERDMSVAGEIYRRLVPIMRSGSEEDRLVAARAFRVGLAALEKREGDF